MKRQKRRAVRAAQRAQGEERESLERSWLRRMEWQDRLRPLVTAEEASREPYHRWLPYRQGFSPALVRLFLEEAAPVEGPVLDPFSGSGTTVVACAEKGRAAVGVDVVASLTRIAAASFGEAPVPWPELRMDDSLDALWLSCRDLPRQAAILLAASRSVDGAGRPKQGTLGPIGELAQVLRMMTEDLSRPLPARGHFIHGDARSLPLADQSMGGVLTSPPYISRYDYSKVNLAMERLLGRGRGRGQRHQVSASRQTARRSAPPAPPAAEEAAQRIEEAGDRDGARAVRGYFADLLRVIAECRRVLRPLAPLWMVVAGADLKREYVPADLILAEELDSGGFTVEGVDVARKLRPSDRRLGGLSGISPREVLIRARRTS